MIDRATVDRILDAVRIEEVIGDFISLRRRGANYLGLCPFHQDKNPSLSVSSTKQIFKCFSCGKAGTAISFLMDHEHLSYPEALRYLAKKYGIDIIEKEETPEEIAGRLKNESLLIVSEFAGKFYQDFLWDSDNSKQIGLSYFRERKFSDDTIRKFGLGYAPPYGNSLAKIAVEKGYKKEFLIEAGLCIEKDNGSLTDRFFDRVMFPIHSISGRLIAFGGRILTSDKKAAKYINSPETEIYVKNRSLYGIYFAKNAIAKTDKCFLVEGYTDVISMHQAGIENVVASSGTSLTVGQINLIKRFTENITVLYDGDAAGIKASLRGIDLILAEGMKVKVVLLPAEEDPDSFAKSHTKDEIIDYVEKHESDFISFKTDILMQEGINDHIKKAALINDIIETISVIPDQIERNVYVDSVAERFDIKSDGIFQKIRVLREKRRSLEQSRKRIEQNDVPDISSTGIPVGETLSSGDYEDSYYYSPKDENDSELDTFIPISNSFLAVSEKELAYYLLKFGEYPLYRDEDMKYNPEGSDYPVIKVADYIISAMQEDELEFENPVYKMIFNEYFNLNREELYLNEDKKLDYEQVQGKIIRRFTTHENQIISREMLDIICDEHPITVKVYRDSLIPEEQMLGKNVPKAVILYKIRVTELACNHVAKELSEAEIGGDPETIKEVMQRFLLLSQVKNALTKESNNL